MKKIVIIVSSVILSLFAIIGLGIGSYKVLTQARQDEMVRVVGSKEAEKEFEILLKNLDKDALTNKGVIKTYEIDYDSLHQSPMGGLFVTLIINKDELLNITYNLDKDIATGKFLPGSSSVSEKLSKLLKS